MANRTKTHNAPPAGDIAGLEGGKGSAALRLATVTIVSFTVLAPRLATTATCPE
ncbi:hypothetical protein AB0M36_20820 [Actinoplanes sp. NPDC051346]|uniref:hypothetical protein n=1 Tax=Actinoplanes sp. NPDC051346 TaxID=3155048 RepID=UPI00341AA81F